LKPLIINHYKPNRAKWFYWLVLGGFVIIWLGFGWFRYYLVRFG